MERQDFGTTEVERAENSGIFSDKDPFVLNPSSHSHNRERAGPDPPDCAPVIVVPGVLAMKDLMRGLLLVCVVALSTSLALVNHVKADHETWPLAGGIVVVHGQEVLQASGEKRLTFGVTFEEPFPAEPSLLLDTIELDGMDISQEIFHTTPFVSESRFLAELISLTALMGTVRVSWVASFQGPCQSHTHCPTTQYCDRYLGCDDCSVCAKLADTFDEGPCPEKCAPYLSTMPTATSPFPGLASQDGSGAMVPEGGMTTTTASPTTNTASGSDPTGSGVTMSGEFPTDAMSSTTTTTTTTTTEVPVPEPCLVCGVETYPCGSECLVVSGLLLPHCYEAAGCAVTYGQGSLIHFNDSSVAGRTVAEARRQKADGAMEKLSSINPHLANPDLRQTIARIESTALCADVVCDPAPQCFDEAVCSNGECLDPRPSVEGTPCDDGNEATDDDACDGNGGCVGIDYCAGVVCEPKSQCHLEGVCDSGVCMDVLAPNGTACDDGLDNTDFDVCDGQGNCVGVDLCQNVVCTAPSQCHLPGTCSSGMCSEVFQPEGHSCDDGNPATDDDACDGQGRCIGVDFCVGVTCQPLSQCHLAGDCANGVCSNPFAPNGTDCDDGDPATDDDVCDGAGNCAGIDYCIGVDCASSSPCQANPRCSSGECFFDNAPNGTKCNDGNSATDFDECQGGVCVGVIQPTVGPSQGMGFVTVATVRADITTANNSAFMDETAIQAATGALATLMPGIYDDDVNIYLLNTTRIPSQPGTASWREAWRVEVNTRVFAEAYVVSRLTEILNGSELTTAITHAGVTQIAILRQPIAELRCLTEVECPVLMCASDEVEYQSQYPSVRRCCPRCLKRSLVFEAETAAYQLALQHYQEAQQQQDEEYASIDLAQYQQGLAVWRGEFEDFLVDAGLWDEQWSNFTQAEEMYYDLVCPP